MYFKSIRRLFFVFAWGLFLGCSPESKEAQQPEVTASVQHKQSVHASHFMVSAARTEASLAGVAILKAGGNAVDAAVAVQMALNVVEPQSSGIGGGLFLLYYDAKTKKTVALDGRETAPYNIKDNIFIGSDGKPLDFKTALVGGRSVGVPGALMALWQLHAKYGKLPWQKLFDPAIALARDGYQITQRLHHSINENKHMAKSPTARDYFFRRKTSKARLVGDVIKNPELAITFEVLAKNGIDDFYHGQIAADIVKAVGEAYVNPGALLLTDLENYQVVQREAVCSTYRLYKICGMPPPSAGGIAVLQMLGILENVDMAAVQSGSVDAVHLFSQASKLAFADRSKYIADPDFEAVPTKELIDKKYLKKRFGQIEGVDKGEVPAGDIADKQAMQWATDPSYEVPGTSHYSIVDALGNAVAVTTSIEHGFGSTLMVDGFLLNNQLTDFSFVSEVDGKKVANSIEPEKRPRSSMAPTMVFDDQGKLVFVLGSPGGARIINYIAQALIGVIDWGMEPQQAFALPHIVDMNRGMELEKNTALVALIPQLKLKSYKPVLVDLNSGLHGMQITRAGLLGGADPRRDGVAMGE